MGESLGLSQGGAEGPGPMDGGHGGLASQPTPNHLTLQGSVQGWALGPGAGPEPRQRQPEPPRAQRRARDLRTRTRVSQVPTGGTWAQGPVAQQGQDGSSPRAESRKRLGQGHTSQWSAGAARAAPPTGEVVAQGAQSQLHSWLCRLLGAHEERSCLAWDPGAGVGWECGCQLGT